MSVAPETLRELQTRVESLKLQLLQSSTSLIFDFFKLRLLQSLTSSNFNFFNLRLHISSNAMAKIVGFLNLLSRWE
jgi:hypothetical protein